MATATPGALDERAGATTLRVVATFFATLTVFGLAVGAMALGAMIQGKHLKGSCGGTGKACECSALKARNCAMRHTREASVSSP